MKKLVVIFLPILLLFGAIQQNESVMLEEKGTRIQESERVKRMEKRRERLENKRGDKADRRSASKTGDKKALCGLDSISIPR